jgi:phosphatidylserine/phosphatidylglycerophosphate/cardiolipin synthase-like enzyme
MHEDLMREIASISSTFPSGVLEPICLDLDKMSADLNANGSMAALRAVPHAQVSHRFKALFQLWKKSHADLPPVALATALRACQELNSHAVRSGALELVWTGPADSPARMRRTEQALKETIRSAIDNLWFVSFAVYSVPGIRDALREAVDRGVMVRFIAEDPDESEGRIDHSISEALGKNLTGRLEVLVWPKEKRKTSSSGYSGVLHVKCALADDKKLFVSSANLSGSAMNLNMELGLLVDGGSAPKQMADHMNWLVSSKTLVPARD